MNTKTHQQQESLLILVHIDVRDGAHLLRMSLCTNTARGVKWLKIIQKTEREREREKVKGTRCSVRVQYVLYIRVAASTDRLLQDENKHVEVRSQHITYGVPSVILRRGLWRAQPIEGRVSYNGKGKGALEVTGCEHAASVSCVISLNKVNWSTSAITCRLYSST